MRRHVLAGLLAVLPLAVSAQTYQAVNLLIVTPLAGGGFEVIEANSEGARGIWCAAASYAEDRLGAPTNAQLYVKMLRAPSVSGLGRRAVVFTIDPSLLSVPPSKSYSVTVDRVGLSLPIGHAIQFCSDYFIDLNNL
jgi:hypothetical protein